MVKRLKYQILIKDKDGKSFIHTLVNRNLIKVLNDIVEMNYNDIGEKVIFDDWDIIDEYKDYYRWCNRTSLSDWVEIDLLKKFKIQYFILV